MTANPGNNDNIILERHFKAKKKRKKVVLNRVDYVIEALAIVAVKVVTYCYTKRIIQK